MTNPLIVKTNEELLDSITPGTQYEFMRRQTVAQQDAAKSAKETAAYTRQNAKYLLWSVIVLALSSVLTLFLTAIGLYLHR